MRRLGRIGLEKPFLTEQSTVKSGLDRLTCPLKTNPNLERESKDSGVCKEAGNDEEAIHERTDYPQAEGSRS